jgi:hypothetical protein
MVGTCRVEDDEEEDEEDDDNPDFDDDEDFCRADKSKGVERARTLEEDGFLFGLLVSTLGFGFFLLRGISRVEVSIVTVAIPSSIDVVTCDFWKTTPRTALLRIDLSDENSTCARKTTSRNMRRKASDSMLVMLVVVGEVVVEVVAVVVEVVVVVVVVFVVMVADGVKVVSCVLTAAGKVSR